MTAYVYYDAAGSSTEWEPHCCWNCDANLRSAPTSSWVEPVVEYHPDVFAVPAEPKKDPVPLTPPAPLDGRRSFSGWFVNGRLDQCRSERNDGSKRRRQSVSVETKLEAGRELDALVAERVMGQERVAACPLGAPNCPGRYEPQVKDWPCLPAYSTSLLPAWAVVEKMPCGVAVHTPDQKLWRCIVGTGPCWETGGGQPTVVGEGDTAPLAICRAALLAVGESDDGRDQSGS